MVIRVPKEQSAFTYFQLESNEGLCFYSTLESSLGEPFRDLELKGHSSLKAELDHLLERLSLEFPMEILSSDILEN
jgi:hypothetical protein